MKVKIIIGILFLSLFSMRGYAQRQFQKPLKTSTQSNYALGKVYLGVSAGGTLSRMALNNLDKTSYLGHWGYRVGFAGEYFFSSCSVGLNAAFAEKGTLMKNSSTFQISMNQNGTMKKTMGLMYDVVALRIPFTYYFKHLISSKRIIPYLFAAPEVDLPMPFCIKKAEDSWLPTIGTPSIETTATINGQNPTHSTQAISPKMDVGAVAGAGMLFMLSKESSSILLKVDVGLNLGMLNQVDASLADKGIFMQNQSLELNATLLFRLKKPLHDACHSFNSSSYQ